MDSIIKTLHGDLVSGKVSCLEMVQEKLSLLSASICHSVNLLLEEYALACAKQVDEKIKSGKTIGALEGIPFGIMDTILLQNNIATGGSDFLKQYNAPYTATAIQKLLDAGAIPLVKESCDSFGHGYANGGAVNVAKGYTAFSIGGGSGVSLLQSAGKHKIYGLKPTYGKISRCGLMANASSTDSITPLASSLEDIRILINTMSGKDPKDPTTYSSPMIPEAVFDSGYKEIVAGYYNNEYLDDAIKNDFQKMVDALSAKGITVKPLDFFDVNLLAAVYDVLSMAETASNLARFDGSVYGASNKDSYMKVRAENFSEETKRRIIGGSLVSSRGYEDVYLKAGELQNAIIDRFNDDFKDVDIILSPVSSRDGWPSVSPWLPALTVPFFTQNGIQIAANKNKEDIILHFANTLKEIQ